MLTLHQFVFRRRSFSEWSAFFPVRMLKLQLCLPQCQLHLLQLCELRTLQSCAVPKLFFKEYRWLQLRMPNAVSRGITLLQRFSRLVTDEEKVAHIHCTSVSWESREEYRPFHVADRPCSLGQRPHRTNITPTRANLAFLGPSESSTGHFSKKQKDDSLRRRKHRAFSRGKSKEAFGRITHSRAVATDASWQGRRMRRGRQPAAGRSWSLGLGGIR